MPEQKPESQKSESPSAKPTLTKTEVLKKLEKGESFMRYRLEGLNFSHHKFPYPANFSGAEIVNCSFEDAVFEDKSTFVHTKFFGNTNFIRTKFSGDVAFNDANFFGETSFWAAEFPKLANFGSVKFYKLVDFYVTQFKGAANFQWARFFGKVNFDETQFFGKAVFGGAKFKASVRFIGNTRGDRVFSKKGETGFRNVWFDQPEQVLFQHVCLGKTNFLGTNLEWVDFTDVEWGREGYWFCKRWEKRKIIYNEEIANQDKNWPLVEKLYWQLKVNYERIEDYDLAGDFHYGQMEMRRKPLPRLKRNFFSLLFWYRLLSGYGERWWWALGWLMVVLLTFGGINMLCGLESIQGKPALNYEITGNFRFLFTVNFWRDYYLVLWYTFYTMIFRSDPNLRLSLPNGHLRDILQYVPGIITSIVVSPLILLAIKRKFRQ